MKAVEAKAIVDRKNLPVARISNDLREHLRRTFAHRVPRLMAVAYKPLQT